MRTKAEILTESESVMAHIPKEGKYMVLHEHLFLEVWIDIRDEISVIKKDLVDLNEYLSDNA